MSKAKDGDEWGDFQDEVAEVESTSDLRRRLAHAERKVFQLSERRAAMAATIRESIEDCYGEFKVRVPRARRSVASKGTEEVAVCMVSDQQLGKKTQTYDAEVCRARMQQYADTILKIATIQNKDHPVKKIHVQMLGDVCEGEGIFPTQSHEISAGIYRQLCVDAAQIIPEFLLTLLSWFEEVVVTGVIGNHGDLRLRMGTADPESNVDRMVYRMVANMFDFAGGEVADRIRFDIPEGRGERNWYAVDTIFDTKFLLMHGDQIRGGITGFWPSAQRKGMGWIDSIPEEWTDLHFGHHHTPTMLTLGRRRARCNGSTESNNVYAQEVLAAIGKPTQWLGFVHPEKGVTGEYWVRLD